MSRIMSRIIFAVNSRQVIGFFVVFLLIFCGVFANTAHAKQQKSRYIPPPLKWQWTETELSAIKKATKKITANPDGSYSLETASWRITTFFSPEFTAQTGVYMDRFAAVINHIFPLKTAKELGDYKPRVVIYNNRADFLKNSGAPEWSGGICKPEFSGRQNKWEITVFTYCDTKNNYALQFNDVNISPVRTLQHEATHALLFCFFGFARIPTWLNEGIANYYGSWHPHRKVSQDGSTKYDAIARIDRTEKSDTPERLKKYYLQKNRELPRLGELVVAVDESFYSDDGGELTDLNYMLAESFIDFLMAAKSRREWLTQILTRVKNHAMTMTSDEIKEYESQWLEFLVMHYEIVFSPESIARYVKQRKQERKKSP